MNKRLLHEFFNDRVISQPNAIAISTSQRKITYRELDICSNVLARQLLKLKVKPNELIAVVMEKGWEQVVAVLGVLKAGAAYLPILPFESKERLENLITIGRSKVIVTQQTYATQPMWPKNKKLIAVEPIFEEPSKKSAHLASRQKEDDLAYVIFTSGSTGTPKGVMITHKAVRNTILDINDRFSVTKKDNVFAISSLIFDLSVYDIFGTLAAGATIVLGEPAGVNDIVKWEQLFFNEQISVWDSVPALMGIFATYLSCKYPKIPPHSLRLVLLSGDWISLSLPKKIWALFGKHVQIISLGGATEGSIWSILYPITKINPEWQSIPYGKPMENQSFYILNKKLQQIPQGGVGELFIGGEGVAKGYWRNRLQTKKQFISHADYGRIYKTGDLGRYLPDGNIEFLGRVDFQVKVSGYRVELNAIEKQLISFPGVRQAIVLPIKANQNQKLGAYIVLDEAYSKIRPITEKDQKTQVTDWQKIYDALFQNGKKKAKLPLLNTAGWVSSYANKNIPVVQMREWVNCTVEKILLLSPKYVLEIGSGTGMLLFRLAKQVKRYDATDFSKNAIFYAKKQIERLGLKNTKLIHNEAIDTKSIHEKYDTIILNSVVQYFPSLDYFLNVINQCIGRISENGYIFIGDIRSLQHLRAFHASVLLSRGHSDHNYLELSNLLDYLMEEEGELIIDHHFFYLLKKLNTSISHVEVLLKDGSFHTEMNCFRYDVVLHINKPCIPITDLNWQDWQLDHICLDGIREKIENKADYIAIKNIPNQRMAGLGIFYKPVVNNDTDWHSYYEKILSEEKCQSVDPGVIYKLGTEYGYETLLTWSEENPIEYFDLILRQKGLFFSFKREFPIKPTNIALPVLAQSLANIPLLPKIRRKFVDDIKAFLKTQLPAYMIPSYFFILKDMPINKNGKIDRKALPTRFMSIIKKKDNVMPKTPIEKKIALIWKKILGIQKIGVKQNFYDVGGTSLLAVQLIIEINKKFKIDCSLEDINLSKTTIFKLSQQVAKKVKRR